MTPAQTALDAMMEGVTAGPWCVYSEPEVGLPASLFAGKIMDGTFHPLEPLTASDMAFIAAARELVPALAAEVRAQRETIAGLEARVGAMTGALSRTAEQALAHEIPAGYGPEDKSQWAKGYDAAIRHARRALKGHPQ
jgi:hypothetical protein